VRALGEEIGNVHSECCEDARKEKKEQSENRHTALFVIPELGETEFE